MRRASMRRASMRRASMRRASMHQASMRRVRSGWARSGAASAWVASIAVVSTAAAVSVGGSIRAPRWSFGPFPATGRSARQAGMPERHGRRRPDFSSAISARRSRPFRSASPSGRRSPRSHRAPD
ncbi:hypothetical protein ISF74_16340 [Burkholderia pseudomallei]|nr:hypothetical protein [Burkholderia pseudomallei]